MITQVKHGDPFPDPAHLGDLLPIGVRLGHTPSVRQPYVKEAPRTWVQNNALIDPYVYSAPLYLQDEVDLTLPPESAESFRWRIRDCALAAGERSGVAIPPIHEMAVEFGAPVPLFTVGGIVSNGWDLKAMPAGSVVYSGHPDKPDLLTVWETTGGKDLKHLMGRCQHRANGEPLTIYSMPGPQDRTDYAIADAAAMSRIALRAWRVGKAYKARQSWCSVFEGCLKALGITHESIADAGSAFGPGDEVTRESSAGLPEGTLLWWSYRSNSAYTVYVRDDSARNRAKTRRVHGWNDTAENSHDRMVVVQTPNEPMAWSVPGWVLSQMPNGVRFRGRHADAGGCELTVDNRRLIETWQHYSILGWPT